MRRQNVTWEVPTLECTSASESSLVSDERIMLPSLYWREAVRTRRGALATCYHGANPMCLAIPGKVAELYQAGGVSRSEEHTSELQSLRHLVCRLLLEKK